MSDDKVHLHTLDQWTNPLGGQEILLEQLDYAHGGISLLRTRIREGRRFTIFEVDPLTARRWGEALCRWADSQGHGQGDHPASGQDGQAP